MNEKFKKVLSGIKERVAGQRKRPKEKVPAEVLKHFNEATNFVIERHKDTIKELEKY